MLVPFSQCSQPNTVSHPTVEQLYLATLPYRYCSVYVSGTAYCQLYFVTVCMLVSVMTVDSILLHAY
jgi:hypothetical protein